MKFELIIPVKTISYRIQVVQTLANDSIEEYTVSGGSKMILFRCNRPEIKRKNSKSRIAWQIVTKNFPLQNDLKMAAQQMLNIQDALEDHIEARPTWRQSRNKMS